MIPSTAFTSDDPFVKQEIGEILNLINQQQPSMTQLTHAQPEPQPQELEGKQIVNRIFEPMARPAPNPYQIGLEQKIGAQKAIWEDADKTLNQNLSAYAKVNGLTEDAAKAMLGTTQQTAHDAAELFRNQLTASGFDTEGYSALGNSSADVQTQLATRQAQDIAEVFNGGAYSMTTDQYYDREFSKAIMSGLSPNRARDLASANARKYQANRVAYLDGLYNSWGHNEAGVTNPIGMQVLGMIAQDNPMLANLYAQVYPTPMNEYNTATDIAKEATKQGYLLDMLGVNLKNDLTKMNEAFRLGEAGKEYDAIRASEKANEDVARSFADYVRKAEFDTANARDNAYFKRQFDFDTEDLKNARLDALLNGIADSMGLTGTMRTKTIATWKGYGTLDDKEAKALRQAGDKHLENLVKQQDALVKILSSTTASESDMATARQQLLSVSAQIDYLNNLLGSTFGYEDKNVSLSDDHDKNIQAVRDVLTYIAKNNGGKVSPEMAIEAVDDLARESGKEFTPEQKQALIIEATKIANGG